MANPKSRNEEILQSIVDDTEYTKVPQSREEYLLLEIKDIIEQGGGGTTDYTDLNSKPQINGVTLNGNKSTADLGLASAEEVSDKYPKAWDIEVTQAQYDALPASKYVDGKNYYITDGNTDEPIIYGFHVDPDESDPSDAVTYLMDAVGMEPARMGTTAFNYGSWRNAFFMPKPCMLKFDGTVDYYLDPNDFSKKVDGTPSDIADYTYQGNVMIEFPKCYYKFEAGTAEGEGYFYVSNQKIDDSYKCWCYLDSDGNETEHFYVAAYNGVTYDGKMRSLSGKKLSSWDLNHPYSSSATYAVGAVVSYNDRMWKCITAVSTAEEFDPTKWEQFGFNANTTVARDVQFATANDTTAKSEWYMDVWCDRVLITNLLYLMGRSLDLQGMFGRGIDTGDQTTKERYITGAANDRGMFYGSTTDGNTVVKVFGIENYWSLEWRRTAGLVRNGSKYSYKMTSSTADGSTAVGYNSTGDGYITTNFNLPEAGFIVKMTFGEYGLLPVNTTGGSDRSYYCAQYATSSDNEKIYTMVGGTYAGGSKNGFRINISSDPASTQIYTATALSCKPLRR